MSYSSRFIQQPTLSQRETEVLHLLAEGLTTNEVAKSLFVSHHTVISHRKNICQKLNAKNAFQLGVYVSKCGLLSNNSYSH
jgi:DNA-binding CsgD family transcriptional regulator